MKDPAFLFYSKDWLEGTAEMLPEEKGVYIDLLAHQHQKGCLPSDLKRLSRLVGLPENEFLPIWEVVKDKFERSEERTVNRKLQNVMKERHEKGRKNKLIGTFGHVLKQLNLNKKEEKFLKKRFKIDELLRKNDNWNTQQLTEWCINIISSSGISERYTERSQNGIALIANANEDIYNINSNKEGMGGKEKGDLNFITNEKMKIIFKDWLEYKKDRKEKYKSEKSIQLAYNKLVKLSDNNPEIAKEIVEQSMANNWAGLFELKDSRGFNPSDTRTTPDMKNFNPKF